MRRLLGLLTVLSLGLGGQLWAQQTPLAEVARKESERRKTVKSPTKVYTNSDVRKGLPLTTAAAPPAKADAAAPAGQNPVGPAQAAGSEPAKPGATAPAAASEEAKDEASWRKRMNDLREQLNRYRLFADALQSRVNALLGDYVGRDDPAQRATIEKDRNDALAEMQRVKVEIARQEQAITDLEEEARKANVPPGWLR